MSVLWDDEARSMPVEQIVNLRGSLRLACCTSNGSDRR